MSISCQDKTLDNIFDEIYDNLTTKIEPEDMKLVYYVSMNEEVEIENNEDLQGAI